MLLQTTAYAILMALLGAAPGPSIPQTNKVPEPLKAKLFGMRGFPALPADADLEKLLPLIDEFGQYRHKDWSGKTKSVADLARYKQEEEADLVEHPGPGEWDQFGGWKAGPQLTPTGRFHAEQRDGKWWLVDPEGRLFWSHGIDCVRTSEGVTPITDRRNWFLDLPAKNSPLAQFYGKATGAAHGYYQDKSYETYNFTAANLVRKYGADWKPRFAETCQRRLRSWGLNTIGNWSDEEIYRLRKTPYVVTVHARGRKLEGSQGYWGKFADVFDLAHGKSLRQDLARQKDKWATDPWCLGVFVDNELGWGDELSLAVAALQSPPEQPAKRVFVEDLTKQYRAIERLNQAWGAQHASWDALLESRAAPDEKKAHDDLTAFYTKTAEQYFRTCRDAVKAVAPDALYLGCRFAWANDRAVRAAAKYCDVVSFNRYKRTLADFRLPEGVDKPVVIGEFHLGTLDRGMFHTGLVPTASQQERAEGYRSYVRSALANPVIVGTHWFQYGDQATTGRSDGENYQIGFIDVCDTPYPETIRASRDVAAEIYRARAESR